MNTRSNVEDHISILRYEDAGDVEVATVWIGDRMVERIDCVTEYQIEELKKKYGIPVRYGKA